MLIPVAHSFITPKLYIFKSLKLNKNKNVLGNNLELKIKKKKCDPLLRFEPGTLCVVSKRYNHYTIPLHSNYIAMKRCCFMRWCSVNFLRKKLKLGLYFRKRFRFLDSRIHKACFIC
jgi:hypothetical protein